MSAVGRRGRGVEGEGDGESGDGEGGRGEGERGEGGLLKSVCDAHALSCWLCDGDVVLFDDVSGGVGDGVGVCSVGGQYPISLQVLECTLFFSFREERP